MTVPISGQFSQADADRHYREIEKVALRHYHDSGLAPWVQLSWMRCLGDHALNPSKVSMPRILEFDEIRRRRIDMGHSYSIAKAEIARLCESFEFAAGVVLTDADGVILLYAGTSSFAGEARYGGFREGAVWSEAEQGTNGMGTCLLTRAPIVVAKNAHFLLQNTRLTCYAAPIVDGAGRLLGALNISCLETLPSGPMMSLLELAVQNIEARSLLLTSRHCSVLRFHPRQEYVGTSAEAVVSFTESGQIVGISRNVMRLLAVASHDSICGRNIEDVLGVDVPYLEHMHRQHASGIFPLPWPGSDRRGFGLLQAPSVQDRSNRLSPALNAGSALLHAEATALSVVLERCQWNVSQAAKELGIGRKTLYRKMHKHRLMRPC